MRRVRFRIRIDHFCAVVVKKDVRMLHKKCMAENRFGRVIKTFFRFLIQSVCAAEIRNAAFRGNACPAEQNNAAALLKDLL